MVDGLTRATMRGLTIRETRGDPRKMRRADMKERCLIEDVILPSCTLEFDTKVSKCTTIRMHQEADS
jgi:hypothetical protein